MDEGNGTSPVTMIIQNDALGRAVAICEVTSATQMLSSTKTLADAPSACGLDIAATGFLTTYSYSNNSTTVTRSGGTPGSRTYQYDAVGRLTYESNPEAWE